MAAQEAARVFFRLAGNGAISISDSRVVELEALVQRLAQRVDAFETIVPACSWPENRAPCKGDACGNATCCADFYSDISCGDHWVATSCAQCGESFCDECVASCEDDGNALCRDCYDEHLQECMACTEAVRGF